MTRPQLKIEIKPSRDGKVFYLPLAPKSLDHGERLKIAVQLKITHVDPDPDRDFLIIKNITFSFPGTEIVRSMLREQHYMKPRGGLLWRGDTATWCNGSVELANGEKRYNQVYLDAPAPARLRINVNCDGIEEPYTEAWDLIPWTDPTGHGPVQLPFALEDLADDEYVVTDATHWFNGEEAGTQIFAHDIVIQARVDGAWTGTYLGHATRNKDVRVFGRPVRAIADGEVIDIEIGHRDNPLNKARSDKVSNFVWVRHGDLEVKYSHLRDGSIIVFDGQRVSAGDQLGEAGNSGRTGGDPHLHLECRIAGDDSLCAMTFHKAWQLARDLVPETGNGRRVSIASRGICEEKAALRPFRRQGFEADDSGPEVEAAPSAGAARRRRPRKP